MCETCAGEADTAAGTCAAITAGTDPRDGCPGLTTCNGLGACFATEIRLACAHDYECRSEHCAPQGVCCASACDATCEICTTGTCAPASDGEDPNNDCPGATACDGTRACWSRALGAACAEDYQCTSGVCTDGVCCNQECNEPCRRCDQPSSPGQCVGVADTTDDVCNATHAGGICTEPPCSCDANAACEYACEPGWFRCDHGCCQVYGGSESQSTCALTRRGVLCWGNNRSAQLGAGCTDVVCNQPVVVPNLSPAKKLAVGGHHVCADTTNGVWCWGNNNSEQLGPGGSGLAKSANPVQGPTLGNISTWSAGAFHSCAVVDGKVLCWGLDNCGQLGDVSHSATVRSSPLALQVTNVSNVTSVTGGAYFTCALTESGEVWCWGRVTLDGLASACDQVVNHPRAPAVRLAVPGNGVASAVTAGASHVCVLVGQDVYCWTDFSTAPTQPALSGVWTVQAGGGYDTAILTDGQARLWGDCSCGQLTGRCGTGEAILAPSITGISALYTGWQHLCAMVNDSVQCWGSYDDVGNLRCESCSLPEYACSTAKAIDL